MVRSHPTSPHPAAPDGDRRVSLRAKLAAASAAAGLVLVVGGLGYAGLQQYRHAAERVEHTTAVRAELDGITAGMAAAEAGARGYVITGDEAFEAQYAQAAVRARRALGTARQLTVDNPRQQEALARVTPVLDRRLALLGAYLRDRRTTELAVVAARMRTGRGRVLGDSVLALVDAADREEVRLLAERGRTLARRGRLLDAVLLGGSLGAFALILLVVATVRHDVLRREAAEARVRAQAAELAAQAEQLEHQQAELEVQLETQQALGEELTRVNAGLEAARAASAAALIEARREEARYRALVEAGAQIVWTTPPSGEFEGDQTAWSAFTGQPPEAYQGWGWLDAVHPQDRDVTAASWEMALAGADAPEETGRRERFVVEHRVRRHDGVYRAMRARAVPVRGDAGEVREWIGVHADVTAELAARVQRETLIAALERSNRDLDQFAYVASHDLRAPLRGISNLSTWIEEDLAAVMTPEVSEQMALLRGRVQRMEALIDGVLQYSRAGRGRGAAEPVDTGGLVREAVELLTPSAGARIEVADGMPTVVAERVPLQQLFLNLVSNALKYAGRPDPLVHVGWKVEQPGWYRFSVADNGPGIAPQYHERVFGIFQTLQARDRVEGTGIGLSIVKKIIEAQGGRVWVESAEGAGATFHFTWPAVPGVAE
jgi:PAS domain S-box-containing protein